MIFEIQFLSNLKTYLHVERKSIDQKIQNHSPNDLPPIVRMKSLRHFRIHFNQLFVKLLVILYHRSIQLDLHSLRTRHILVQPVIIVLADPRVVHQNFPKDGFYVIVGATDDDRELPPREKIVDLDRPKKKKERSREN